MRTMDRLEKSSRGSFIWTLLQRRALEIVEQLKPEEYQIEGGEEVLFKLLDQRWPEKGRHDEMWETIAEVFALHGKDGESLRQWSARAREVIDRCARRCFPDEARGWTLPVALAKASVPWFWPGLKGI